MAGLPWIQLHVDLPRHPKSVRLGVRLRDERAWTYMAQLWLWCAEHVHDGRVRGVEADDAIEFAAGWRGEQGRLVSAAIDAGFLERDGESIIVHGWEERAAAHVKKRERDLQRWHSLHGARESETRQRVVSESSASDQRVVSDSPRKREREIESNKKPSPPTTRETLSLDVQEPLGLPMKPGSPFVCFLRDKYPDIRDPWDFEERCVAAFPGIDLLAEALKAYAKEGSDPRRKKTRHGPYLTNWFGYAQQNASRSIPRATGPPGVHKATAQPSPAADFLEPPPFGR